MKNKYIEELLNDNRYVYYAHTKSESNEKELLLDHLKLTYEYYEKMEKYKNLENKIKNIISITIKSDDFLTEKIYNMFKSAIYYHDIGKINPLFQKNKMNNELNIDCKNLDSKHSALSARIYIDFWQKSICEEIESNEYKYVLFYITYYFGYIISRHHAKLERLSEVYDAIKNQNIPQIPDSRTDVYENHLKLIDKVFFEKFVKDKIPLYILCKLLYSCIVTSDFYATYEFMTGKKIPIDTEKNSDLFNEYDNSELLKNIRKYECEEMEITGINQVRSDIFLESETNLLDNMDNDIYYLEAPTGAGKTNMAINIAKHLYKNISDIKSIQYIFPFNTIIEQTANTFNKYFKNYEEYTVINSTTSLVDDKNEEIDYEQIYIKNAFKQYPIIITSHVNLFNTLFGNGKEANYSLYHLIDSVIVIDEIQAYSNSIWREIIEMFSKYSKLLNIKFVIMSATLPRLDKLLKQNITNFFPLIKNTRKYYDNILFKNRVSINYDLLEKKMSLEELCEEILKYKDKKVLVELIKKDSADKVYSILSQKLSNVDILTGDDNKYRRMQIIARTRQNKPIILVSTQTIEAGVDIDMDIGFKDISFLDSEEQFLGRINRSANRKNCKAYFFNIDNANTIYNNDNRLEFSLMKPEVKKWLIDKDFEKFYDKVLEKIYDKTSEYTTNNIDRFYGFCSRIDFYEIQKRMKLIKTNTIQIFLNYTINIDGEEIIGSEVFNEYIELCRNQLLSYAEKKIKLSKISEKINLFVYSFFENSLNIIQGDKYGDMYYIEDGENYIENGRFNRQKYISGGDGLFL